MERGDIVLTHWGTIKSHVVSLFTRSQYSHCGLYLGHYVLIHSTMAGVDISEWVDWRKRKLKILRPKNATTQQKAQVLNYCFSKFGEPYVLFGGLSCTSLIYEAYLSAGIDLLSGKRKKLI